MAKNCYLIEGSDKYSLQKEITKIIKKNGFSEESVTYYDLEENTLAQVIEDLDTYSFLTPRKVVAITNSTFLKATSNIKIADEEIEAILKYLKNPNPDVLFIMVVSKCDERKKVVKEIKKLTEKIIVATKPFEIIQEVLQDYKISNNAKQMILEYCGEDSSKIIQECEKLKMFAIDTLEIKEEDIEEIVIKKIPDTEKLAFDLVKYIALRDKTNIFKQYNLLKEYNFEPHSMIGLIESQVRLIYQVMFAKRKGMTKDEIAKVLKEHPFRIQKTLEFLPYYEENDIRKLIHNLHNLDYKIKSGQESATIGFEMFLLNL